MKDNSPLKFSPTHKECRKCGDMKVHNNFHRDANKYGLAYWCKECANKNSRKHHARRMEEDPSYRAAKRNSYIKSAHGITAQQYEDMLVNQNYLCSICGVKLSGRGGDTHLDHCHKSGKLRAMLCTNCNRGLGHFQENVTFLKSAIKYLESHNDE